MGRELVRHGVAEIDEVSKTCVMVQGVCVVSLRRRSMKGRTTLLGAKEARIPTSAVLYIHTAAPDVTTHDRGKVSSSCLHGAPAEEGAWNKIGG